MIKRTLLHTILPRLGEKKILIIRWPRQVWKTTLLQTLRDMIHAKWKQSLYFSIDRELHEPYFQDVKTCIQFFEQQLQHNPALTTIFFDEIQYINQSWLFLKILFDYFQSRVQFIVTGSSSLEITKNSEFLTWRKVVFEMTTISLYEYIHSVSEYSIPRVALSDIETLRPYLQILEREAHTYMQYGGYPEVLTASSHEKKKTILKELVSTYLQKDIAWYFWIESLKSYNNLLVLLAHQVGSLVNKNEISTTLQINHTTTTKYLDILTWTFLIDLITPYHTNIRKELTKMPKVYYRDIWLLRILTKKRSDSTNVRSGQDIENIVYLQLLDQFPEGIQYRRTKQQQEVDFVVHTQSTYIPIEVKYSTKGKVWSGLSAFNTVYPSDTVIVVTKDTLDIKWAISFIPRYALWFVEL